MYAQQRKRDQFKDSLDSMQQYLDSLGLELDVSCDDRNHAKRISQLTQKTNQFNAMTRRYMHEDIMKFIESENYRVFAFSAKDKFGDYGLIGVIIAEVEKVWKIDTFLLSCRAIGREIENAMVGHVIKKAMEHDVNKVIVEYEPSGKNNLVREFLEKSGFEVSKSKVDETQIWAFDAIKEFNLPSHIKITE